MYNCGQASLIIDKPAHTEDREETWGWQGRDRPAWLESESCGVEVLGKLLSFSPSLSCLWGELSPGPLLWVPGGLKTLITDKTLLGSLSHFALGVTLYKNQQVTSGGLQRLQVLDELGLYFAYVQSSHAWLPFPYTGWMLG